MTKFKSINQEKKKSILQFATEFAPIKQRINYILRDEECFCEESLNEYLSLNAYIYAEEYQFFFDIGYIEPNFVLVSKNEESGNNNKDKGTIYQFVKEFSLAWKKSRATLDNPKGFNSVYNNYMIEIYKDIFNNKEALLNSKNVNLEKLYRSVESYIGQLLYDSVFPKEPTELDIEFYNKCEELSWIKPINLSIVGKDISFGYIEQGINCIIKYNSSNLLNGSV